MHYLTLLALVLACDAGKVTIDGDIGDGDDGPAQATDSGLVEDSAPPEPVDADGDGVFEEEDCDDANPNIYPGADEHCDGVDEDCDDLIDEDSVDMPTGYLDADSDGYGTADAEFNACVLPANAVTNDFDCDDSDDEVHPDAEEICHDGVDNNCDGSPGGCHLEGLIALETAGAIVRGSRPDDRLGTIAAGIGDVNGDGLDDLAIGLPNDDTETLDAGLAGVFFGPVSGEFQIGDAQIIATGSDVSDGVGNAVCGVGYVNDDILADFAIGAAKVDAVGEDSGAVYILMGRDGAELSVRDADTTYIGEAAGDHAGGAIVLAGDLDGDGLPELAIGAERANDDTGTVYLMRLGTLGTFPLAGADLRLQGEVTGEHTGRSLEAAGDLNGDGTDDLLVGAPYQSGEGSGTNSGRVYLVMGGADLASGSIADAGFRIDGQDDNSFVGFDIASVGDVNEDGHPDLALAAYNGDSGGTNAGEIYIFLGPFEANRSTTDADITIVGEAADDQAGYALAAGGDLNQDGLPDLLVGSYGNDAGGNNAGAAYILYAPFDDPLDLNAFEAKIAGENDDDWTGAHLGRLGDMDGDDTEDLFVSSPLMDDPAENAGALHIFYGNSGL
jgi:hypothetical protein